MEVDAVGRSEPDVFVEEAEASRRNVIGLGDARQHRLVDKPILERHQAMSSSWERPSRGKTPSFSSSLLESIYHSIDESQGRHDHRRRNNNSLEAGQEIASLRRAIMVEKWMENCTNNKNAAATPAPAPVKTLQLRLQFLVGFHGQRILLLRSRVLCVQISRKPKTPRKSNILSFYAELKKTKQPISPGRKIRNFLNSIFASKNNNKPHREYDGSAAAEEWSSVRKSRSMKASTTAPSCLSKTPSSKSKRSNDTSSKGQIISYSTQTHSDNK
nr:protein BIG GRAIN 1-like A [Ipomoea batatas]